MNSTKYCYNAFVGRMILTRAQNVSLAAIMALMIPFLIICNAAVIVGFYKTKQLSSVCNWSVVALSVSDGLIGIISMPLYCVLLITFGHERVCWYELLTMMVVQMNSHFSAYTIVVIALQRYLKARPRFAETWLTEKLVSKGGTVFTCSIALFLSILHGMVSTNFFNTITTSTPKIIMMIINICLVVSVYVCYIRLYRSIKVHVANTRSLSVSAHRHGSTATTIQPYYTELAKTMCFILATFAVTSIPYLITDFITGWYTFVLKVDAPQTMRFLYYLSFWPLVLNAVLNAVILLYRNKKAVKYIRNCMTIISCSKPTAEVVSTPSSPVLILENTVWRCWLILNPSTYSKKHCLKILFDVEA